MLNVKCKHLNPDDVGYGNQQATLRLNRVTKPETRGRALFLKGEKSVRVNAHGRTYRSRSPTTRHKLIPVSYARQPVWGYPKHRAIIINCSRRLDGPPPLEIQRTYIYGMLPTSFWVSSPS